MNARITRPSSRKTVSRRSRFGVRGCMRWVNQCKKRIVRSFLGNTAVPS
jgi:hypothetical protein